MLLMMYSGRSDKNNAALIRPWLSIALSLIASFAACDAAG
jgi:hypothetical protein